MEECRREKEGEMETQRAEYRKGQQKPLERGDGDGWGASDRQIKKERERKMKEEDRCFSADLRSVLGNARSLGD